MGAFSDDKFDLEPQRVKELVEGGEAQLVDVREPYEWEAGRIAGAVHIELERLAGRAEEIDKETPVIFQCRMGSRSGLAMQAFRAAGYDAYNMDGGIKAWAEAGPAAGARGRRGRAPLGPRPARPRCRQRAAPRHDPSNDSTPDTIAVAEAVEVRDARRGPPTPLSSADSLHADERDHAVAGVEHSAQGCS